MPWDLDALTARRARLVTDRWRAVRPAAPEQTPTLDGDGNVVIPNAPVVHEGPGLLSDPTTPAQNVLTGTDESGVPSQRVLKLGDDADLLPGDVVTCVSARRAHLVGDAFVVVAEQERSLALYRRFIVRGSSWASTS